MAIAESVLLVKIIGSILIFIFGFIGCSAPVLAHYGSRRSVKVAHFLGFVQQLMMALGAGVVLATALLHIVPEGIEAITQGGLGGEAETSHGDSKNLTTSNIHQQPLLSKQALVKNSNKLSEHDIAAMDKESLRAALIAVLTEDQLATGSYSIEPLVAKKLLGEDEPPESHSEPYPYGYLFVFVGLAITFVAESELHRLAGRTKAPTLKAHLVEGGVAVHSILVGVALGTMTNADAANTLMIALIFHQMCEGFAVGPMIQKGATSVSHAAIMILIFASSTPTGVLLGALIDQYSDPNAKGMLLAKGTLMLIASGLLIFVGCVEFLGGLQHDDVEHQAHEAEKLHKKKANRRREKRILQAAERSLQLAALRAAGTIVGDDDHNTNTTNNHSISTNGTHSPREDVLATRASCCQQENMVKAAAGGLGGGGGSAFDVAKDSSDDETSNDYATGRRTRSSFIETWGGPSTTKPKKHAAHCKNVNINVPIIASGSTNNQHLPAPMITSTERSRLLPSSYGSTKSRDEKAAGIIGSEVGTPVSSRQKSDYSSYSEADEQAEREQAAEEEESDHMHEEDHKQISDMKKDFLSLHPLLTRMSTYLAFFVGGAIMSVIALWS